MRSENRDPVRGLRSAVISYLTGPGTEPCQLKCIMYFWANKEVID